MIAGSVCEIDIACQFDAKQTLGTIYPTPRLGQDMTQGQFLSGV